MAIRRSIERGPFRNDHRALPSGPRAQKNRCPQGQGTSGICLVVPPHFAVPACDTTSTRSTILPTGQPANGGPPSPPTTRHHSVRSAARRSYSPAFAVPHLSRRGSLPCSHWEPVPVIAVGGECTAGRTRVSIIVGGTSTAIITKCFRVPDHVCVSPIQAKYPYRMCQSKSKARILVLKQATLYAPRK